ncbi:6,7-dimethyl-8-ribityllumazine synthase [bacterium]|nr:6,7-dimethyl-8-ribityllumazine synthase [bacterium]
MANYSDQEFLKTDFSGTDFSDLRIAVVTAKWNWEVTGKLKQGALDTLLKAGVNKDHIKSWDIPGSYELVYAANKLSYQPFDAIICLGCVIQGETRHFDFICSAVAQGLHQVSIKHDKPVAFGVLTTDNQEQALERAGGKHGNKGEEAAITILQLLQK